MSEWSTIKAVEVWATLSGIYGSRFLREFGESPPAPWVSAIGSLKDFEITRGLRHLSNGGSGSPPTLPQFLKACRQSNADDVVRPSNTFLPPPAMDSIAAFGNRVLLGYLMEPKRKNPSEASLQRLVEAKNRIIGDFRQIEREDPTVQSDEIRAALTKEFNRQYEPGAAAELAAARERFTLTGNACGSHA